LGMAKERDPMWTEGLLQASRAVANAVKALAEAAALAAAGKIDDQALIAAARAVASATAQLVTASRAGGGGDDSDALDRAADAITRATRGLVEAARLIGNAEMKSMERSALDQKVVEEEIEMTANILRIQKQIEKAERKLNEMRHGNKSKDDPPSEAKPSYMYDLEKKTAAREAAQAGLAVPKPAGGHSPRTSGYSPRSGGTSAPSSQQLSSNPGVQQHSTTNLPPPTFGGSPFGGSSSTNLPPPPSSQGFGTPPAFGSPSQPFGSPSQPFGSPSQPFGSNATTLPPPPQSFGSSPFGSSPFGAPTTLPPPQADPTASNPFLTKW